MANRTNNIPAIRNISEDRELRAVVAFVVTHPRSRRLEVPQDFNVLDVKDIRTRAYRVAYALRINAELAEDKGQQAEETILKKIELLEEFIGRCNQRIEELATTPPAKRERKLPPLKPNTAPDVLPKDAQRNIGNAETKDELLEIIREWTLWRYREDKHLQNSWPTKNAKAALLDYKHISIQAQKRLLDKLWSLKRDLATSKGLTKEDALCMVEITDLWHEIEKEVM